MIGNLQDGVALDERGRASGGRPLRIAFLCYRGNPHVGGQGVFLSQAAGALAARGHMVDLICGPPYPDVPEGCRLIQLPSLDLYEQPHKGYLSLRWRHLLSWTDTKEYFGHLFAKFMEPETFGDRVANYLRDHCDEYDVVLDNQTLAYGLLRIERLGLPVVEVAHHPIRRDLEIYLDGEKRWGHRALMKRWYSFLSMQERVAPKLRRVIVESESAKRDLGRYLGIEDVRMTTVFLGVDPVFKPQPHVARLPARLVTTASADMPLKGLRYLIEAYAKLRREHPALELTIVGRLREGPTKQQIERLALQDHVRFVHDLSGEDLAALYASATICVSPSLYEGFGLPAAEAMCCGAPVVVTDGGALPEVVGEAGVVVPKANSDALAEAIGALLNSSQRLAAMSETSLARAHLFDWARVAAEYEDILRAELAQC